MSHFNDKAAQWDDESKIKMMQKLAVKTMEHLNLMKPVDVMDFGCGTGLFGLEFSNQAQSLLGVDTSEGMLKVFNEKTKGDKRIASRLIDLEKSELEGQTFDLIVSSMAFHHLNKPADMIRKLKNYLNQGGKIAIVDLDQEDGTFHPNNKEMGVQHFGFSKGEIESWAKSSGMNLKYEIIHKIEKNEKTYSQFLAVFS